MPHDKLMRVTLSQNQVVPPPSQARQRIRSADISQAIFKSAPHVPKPRYHFNEHPQKSVRGRRRCHPLGRLASVWSPLSRHRAENRPRGPNPTGSVTLLAAFQPNRRVRAGGRAARAPNLSRLSRSRRMHDRSHPGDGCEHLIPQLVGDRDFGQLESDISRMSHELGADLDQSFAQVGQGPECDFGRHSQGANQPWPRPDGGCPNPSRNR